MIVDPMPRDPLGAELCKIFSYRWMTIEGKAEDTSAPNWKTIDNYPLRPRSLWLKWLDAKVLVGVRFSKLTGYFLIDIDAGSQYHSPEGITAVQDALETIGICRTIVMRSSWSGGIHIYCPLPEQLPTFDVACAIRYCLEAHELFIEPGQLETFPNTKSFGRSWLSEFVEYNAHRLPLQPGSGSVLLDDQLRPMGADLSKFLAQWKFAIAAQDSEAFEQALTHGRDQHRKRPQMRSHPVDEWRADLELDISEGWTGPGQTNALLKAIACYGRVFERLADEELAEYVQKMAITRPGFDRWCGHQFDIGRKAAAWARSATRFYWPLGEEPKRDKAAFDLNAERSEDAKSRIKSAVRWLEKKDLLPEEATARLRKVSQLAKASFKTLYKYLELWHPLKRCITDHTAGATAFFIINSTDPDKPPKPLKKGRLHTFTKLMKGVRVEAPLKKHFPPDREGGLGGEEGFPQATGGFA